MPKEEREFFPHDEIEWESFPEVPGLYQKILSRDPDTGDYTRILRWEPGTDSSPMGVQVHDFWEEVFIFEGSIHDIPLDQTFSSGMYACRPPGMKHGPWRSENGAMMLEIRYHKK